MVHATQQPDFQRVQFFILGTVSRFATNISLLGAGEWSRAYAFDVGDQQFVFRLGSHDEDFAKDRIAATFKQPELPVPAFVDMGIAFDRYYAVTVRAQGKFLDQLAPMEAARALPSLLRSLEAMRNIPVARDAGFGGWDRNGMAAHPSWSENLLAIQDEHPRIAGWKARLASWSDCDAAFASGMSFLESMVDDLPNEQNVVHGDLLNRNVLVDKKRGQLTSVFDWGCSSYGDFLYEIAWLTFWAPHTPGIDPAQVRKQARAVFREAGANVEGFDERIRCYEVHIGLDSIAYNAFQGRRDEASVVTEQMLAAMSGKFAEPSRGQLDL